MSVTHILTPVEKNLGEFTVKRVLPSSQQKMVGPWLFFDHAGPAEFAPGPGINVRPHPHINLATVTYLFEGEVLHRDSLGSEQTILPGDINLMVAGKGITHSERECQAIQHTSRKLHGLQLWHALPEKDEQIDPAFYHYTANELPRFKVNNNEIRLMIGQAYNHQSPVKTFADTLYIEANLKQKSTLTLPKAEQLAIYVVTGQIQIENKQVDQHQMAILKDHATGEIKANQHTLIAIIGGEKMTPRYLEWNFASSKQANIEQAKKDWMNGKFPKVPGDEEEFIPLPEQFMPK